MTRKVLGIDPGFDRFGVAILEAEKQNAKLLYSECIVTKSQEERPLRLLQIGERLKELIAEWQPQEMAIEKLFFNANTTSAIGVAEARGVASFIASEQGLSVSEYSPQDVKIAVTGYGKADKDAVQMMVRKLVKLGDEKRLDDEIDAIAVGITHIATRGE